MDYILEKIRLIKKSRLKPEEKFLCDIFWNLKPNFKGKLTNYIYYIYDNKIIFQYNINSKQIYCDYFPVWNKLDKEYNLRNEEIESLIFFYAHRYLNITVSKVLLMFINKK